MKLPPELRNRIYTYVLPFNSCVSYSIYGPRRGSDIVRTSKSIRSETLPILYGNNHFRVNLEGYDHVNPVITWLRNVTMTCGSKPFASFRLQINGSLITLLKRILQFANIIRESGLVIAIAVHDVGSFMLAQDQSQMTEVNAGMVIIYHNFSDESSFNVYPIVKHCLDLGQAAFNNGWSRETLNEKYEDFVESKLVLRRGRLWLCQEE